MPSDSPFLRAENPWGAMRYSRQPASASTICNTGRLPPRGASLTRQSPRQVLMIRKHTLYRLSAELRGGHCGRNYTGRTTREKESDLAGRPCNPPLRTPCSHARVARTSSAGSTGSACSTGSAPWARTLSAPQPSSRTAYSDCNSRSSRATALQRPRVATGQPLRSQDHCRARTCAGAGNAAVARVFVAQLGHLIA